MTRDGISLGAFATGLVALLAPSVGLAHGLDAASLGLRETRPGVFEVRWQASTLRLPGADVQPMLPAHCRQIGAANAVDGADRVTLVWTVDCGPGGLAGGVVGVDDLAAAKINALLSIQRLDGEKTQTVLSPRNQSLAIPTQPSGWEVVRGYVARGFGHILTGPDHLLFVLGLLLLVSAPRLLVQTIAAFTLGHSLALAASALQAANVPARPVEVLIALSVLALAVELARKADRPTLLRRFPWAMAIAFGLLHGLGFAGALAEAGLPAGDVPLALVSFNGGIEIGQLAFVGAVLTAGMLCRRWLPAMAGRSTRAAVYAMGVLSAFWCFERAAAWLG
jgi:hydrogenase/urease accessory protein HupE